MLNYLWQYSKNSFVLKDHKIHFCGSNVCRGHFDKDFYYNIKELMLPSARHEKASEDFQVG